MKSGSPRTAAAGKPERGLHSHAVTIALGTLLVLFLGFTSLTLGHQDGEAVRIKCDTTVWSLTNYPPKPDKSNEDLNTMINLGLQIGTGLRDEIKFIYVGAVIDCEGNAAYRCFNKTEDTAGSRICAHIIEVLKNSCKWTPGKVNKDTYENVIVKKGNKTGYIRQKVIEYVHYNYSMKFELRKGKLTRCK